MSRSRETLRLAKQKKCREKRTNFSLTDWIGFSKLFSESQNCNWLAK